MLSPPAGGDQRGDQNRKLELLAIIIPATFFSTATVALRIYTRAKVVRNVGWDDHTIVATQAMSLVGMLFSIEMVLNGFGRHMYYLSIEQIAKAGLYNFIAQVFYILATAMVKCSACLFLLRIMARGTSKWLHWFLYIMIAVLAVLSIVTVVGILLQCTPPAASWDPRVKGKCWSNPRRLGIGYAHVAWSILTDFVCALFPVLILWKIQMKKRIKYALWAIMSVGMLATICCIIKLSYLGKLEHGDFTCKPTPQTPMSCFAPPNQCPDNAVDLNLWGPLELNIGIIAASIPALQPLFKTLLLSPSQSQPGARNNPVLLTWRRSTSSPRSQAPHSIGTHAKFGSEESFPPATAPLENRGKGRRNIWGVRFLG